MRTFAFITLVLLMTNPLTLLAAETSTFTVGLTVTSTSTGGTTGTTGGTTGTTGGTTGGNGGPSENLPPQIFNINVIPNTTTATVNFQTAPHTQSIVQFGKTVDYELGAVSGTSFVTDHSTTLTALEANTRYYYSITATDGFGKTTTVGGLSFVTNGEGVVVEPGVPINPTTFTATPRVTTILLNWEVPERPTAEVRIVKSKVFFPNDPMDGEIIYEGKANAFVDREVTPGTTYYYTLFVKQGDSYSSGVIAKATLPSVGTEPLPPLTDPFIDVATSTTVDPKITALTLDDFLFVQDNQILNSGSNRVVIDGTKNLSVILPYDRVPEILKTIGITLVDPEDPKKTFSFLLRINNDKTAYVATIAPLGRSGIYNLSITILDYKNQGLKVLSGALLAQAGNITPLFTGTLRNVNTIFNCPPFYLGLVLSLILVAALPRGRKQENLILSVAR